MGLATGRRTFQAISAGTSVGRVFSRYLDSETMPSSTDARTGKRGAKGSPGTLDPPRVATRAHGYLVASLARSRPRPSAKQKAGGSRPGGATTGAAHTHHEPVTR